MKSARGLHLPLLVALMLAVAAPASARNMEGHQLFVGIGLGPGVRLPSALGASPAELMVMAQGEYTLNRRFSTLLDFTLGAGSTVPVLGHVGVKGRLHDLGLALSPYGLAEFGFGGLIDVMGANLPWVGARLGIGADYFVTRRTLTGVGLYFDLGGTTGERPAFYGLVQLVLTVAVDPFKPHPSRSITPSAPASSPAPRPSAAIEVPTQTAPLAPSAPAAPSAPPAATPGASPVADDNGHDAEVP